jgi:hypothetical protein
LRRRAGAFPLAGNVRWVCLTPFMLAAVVSLYSCSIFGIVRHALLILLANSSVPLCPSVGISGRAVISLPSLCQFFFALFWIGIPTLSVTGAPLLLLFAKLRIGSPSLAAGGVVSLSGRGVRKFSTLPLALSLCRLRLDPVPSLLFSSPSGFTFHLIGRASQRLTVWADSRKRH